MGVTESNGTVKFEGLVLFVSDERGDLEGWERAYHVHYWDEATQSVKNECYAHTRAEPKDNGVCKVDATLQVRIKWAQMLSEQAFGTWKDKALENATTAEVGREVIVTKGRKVKIGTVGEVFWARMQPRWGRNNGSELRIGIKVGEAQTVYWLSADNVTTAHPEEYMPSFEEGEYQCDREALERALSSYRFVVDDSDRNSLADSAARAALIRKMQAAAYPEREARKLAGQVADAKAYLEQAGIAS